QQINGILEMQQQIIFSPAINYYHLNYREPYR
ncbi:hypothetical protein KYG_19296, partial [Acidovorax sp. NO-1]